MDEEPQTNWSFQPEAGANEVPAKQVRSKKPAPKEVSWSASEFIHNHKGFGWYALLILATLVLGVVVYFATKDLMSVIVIAVASVAFGYLAMHKPRELPYRVDGTGIYIGEKFYNFSAFKSFSVLQEGPVGCINLLPLKRLMPEISVYYPLDEEDKIIEILLESLPNEQRKEQGVDRLMKRIRF